MRRIGQSFMLLGAAVGGAVGLAILLHVHPPGISWLLAVGLAKLCLATSCGLIAAGAVFQRLASRREQCPPALLHIGDDER